MRKLFKFFKSALFRVLEFGMSAVLLFIFSISRALSIMANSGLHYKVWGQVKEIIDKQTITIRHFSTSLGHEVEMRFASHNRITHYRAVTFSEKEPEILEWIDKYGSWGPFWDVGANVGLYSVYFGSIWDSEIFCFEPSVFNLPSLVRNINLNHLSDRANIVPFALNDRTARLPFNLSSLSEGAASNSFGVDYTFDGSPLSSEASFILPGMSGDGFNSFFAENQRPALVKIDVDGIEHFILKGMKKVLTAHGKRTVFIEVNQHFEEQKNGVVALLTEFGYRRMVTAQSEMVARSKRSQSTFNEIWIKD